MLKPLEYTADMISMTEKQYLMNRKTGLYYNKRTKAFTCSNPQRWKEDCELDAAQTSVVRHSFDSRAQAAHVDFQCALDAVNVPWKYLGSGLYEIALGNFLAAKAEAKKLGFALSLSNL